MDGLVPVPPFNILEPEPTYQDGLPRQDGKSAALKKVSKALFLKIMLQSSTCAGTSQDVALLFDQRVD